MTETSKSRIFEDAGLQALLALAVLMLIAFGVGYEMWRKTAAPGYASAMIIQAIKNDDPEPLYRIWSEQYPYDRQELDLFVHKAHQRFVTMVAEDTGRTLGGIRIIESALAVVPPAYGAGHNPNTLDYYAARRVIDTPYNTQSLIEVRYNMCGISLCGVFL